MRYFPQKSANSITDAFLACVPPYDTNGPGFGPVSAALLTTLANDLRAGVTIIGDPPAPEATPSGLGALILTIAKPFVGLYETVDNTDWAMPGTTDKTEANAFKALLEGIGWEPPESYCMAAVKGWWKAAFAQAGRDFSPYDSMLGLGVMESYDNANTAGLITRTPQPGAICFMQDGEGGSGHAWLFRGMSGAYALSREANTSLDPDAPASEDRDGGRVADKQRLFSFAGSGGLHLVGCLNPPV